ncbi:membrane protein insertase YidC [Alsobacter sp. SYSU M60028]|uniref:Membrane protein insertase YidC n=1 Tax=Alsobacter ponti TaxID=2962936 RepID=A0ABT1LJA7_9HYPH|nr:membrane protein insertase YidC [Alsobacter ponti]MCP8940988.1 membrane protein insertase YidC [Alsobacter ponti]
MADNKNFIIAIALSMAILIGWNVFFGVPKLEQQRQQVQMQQGVAPAPQAGAPAPAAPASPGALAPDGSPAAAPTRDAALAAAPRLPIETSRLRGSIALRGGDIDDIALRDYRETVDPNSPNIVVFSPANGPDGYFARTGWLPAAGIEVPNAQTLWTADKPKLTETDPVTLSWDNGKGLVFKRRIEIDSRFMLTVTDSVEAQAGAQVSLAPYGLIRRIGTPHVAGYYILHEGLLGVLGDQGLQEFTYAALDKETARSATEKGKEFTGATGGWAGITDKYWASALIPDQATPFNANFTVNTTPAGKTYQTLITLPPVQVAQGASASSTTRLFVGAKEVATVDGYEKQYNIKLFDRLIDWGIFYWITKPLFRLIDMIYKFVGNFGVAILVVTVLVKAAFFPLANKSYSSMAKMKAVQPQMAALKEMYPDDRVKQQQELMELYKREKINPLAGCLPVVIQIPVFFALYKVLFVTIEMRHAPFFGWIHDLAAPDPSNIFTLFGLIPWSPPHVLALGAWPIIMGFTMFVQMKMNPEPQDPVQKTMFTWMPVFFTYLLSSFPAGLVIYWSWNNTLSVAQQYAIMKRQGVKVELWSNLAGVFGRKSAGKSAAAPAPASVKRDPATKAGK